LKNARDDYGNTALTFASVFANKETVQILVEEMGLNVSDVDFLGRNSFLSAVEGSKIETLRYLNSKDPTLKNARDNVGDTALRLASWSANKETVQFLVEEMGLNISDVGFLGRNSFLAAVVGSKIETLRYLNSKDPTLKNARSYYGDTALTLASKYANKETVQVLVEEMGLTISAVGFNGRNSFLRAASRGKIETLRYLNSKDPNLKHARDDNRDTALTLASQFANTETVQVLVEDMGLNISDVNFHGRNSFLVAVAGRKIETLLYLNSKDPNLKNAYDKYGNSASDLASQYANNETVQLLASLLN
jgi:ankyrin repeat protein